MAWRMIERYGARHWRGHSEHDSLDEIKEQAETGDEAYFIDEPADGNKLYMMYEHEDKSKQWIPQ